MHDYLIAFDLLDQPRDDYKYLWFKLTSLRARQLLDNVFVVSTEDTAVELNAELRSLLRENDRLLVIGISATDSGSFNLKQPL